MDHEDNNQDSHLTTPELISAVAVGAFAAFGVIQLFRIGEAWTKEAVAARKAKKNPKND